MKLPGSRTIRSAPSRRSDAGEEADDVPGPGWLSRPERAPDRTADLDRLWCDGRSDRLNHQPHLGRAVELGLLRRRQRVEWATLSTRQRRVPPDRAGVDPGRVDHTEPI